MIGLFWLDQKSGADERANQEHLHERAEILKGAARPSGSAQMKEGDDPDQAERKKHRPNRVRPHLRKYLPKAIAASAMGAAKPTVAETMPAMNPSAG